MGHKADVCKEKCDLAKQQGVKGSCELEQIAGKVCGPSVFSGEGKITDGASSSHVKASVIDKDMGEWTIVIRRRRPNNARAGYRTQVGKEKPDTQVSTPKAIWREVNKIKWRLELLK